MLPLALLALCPPGPFSFFPLSLELGVLVSALLLRIHLWLSLIVLTLTVLLTRTSSSVLWEEWILSLSHCLELPYLSRVYPPPGTLLLELDSHWPKSYDWLLLGWNSTSVWEWWKRTPVWQSKSELPDSWSLINWLDNFSEEIKSHKHKYYHLTDFVSPVTSDAWVSLPCSPAAAAKVWDCSRHGTEALLLLLALALRGMKMQASHLFRGVITNNSFLRFFHFSKYEDKIQRHNILTLEILKAWK